MDGGSPAPAFFLTREFAMGRLVAIGGGDYEENDAIVREIVRLSGKERPNGLFIGTALQDSTNPLTSFKKSLKRVAPGSVVKKLSIIRSSYTEEEIDALFDFADIIFCGGGNTKYMLDEWEKAGLIPRLLNAFRQDTAVLAGVSAGALCWFEKGYTDSEMFSGEEQWAFEVIRPKTALFPYMMSPHYDNEIRAGFDDEVAKQPPEDCLPAIGLSDRTAFVHAAGEEYFVRSDETRMAWRIYATENGLKKARVNCYKNVT